MQLFYIQQMQQHGLCGELINMKRICSLIILLIVLLNFASCKATSQVSLFPEMVKYNLFRSDSKNEFSFNINVLSSEMNPKIEFVCAEGFNTDNLSVFFSNDTFDSIKGKRIENSYVTLLGIHCTSGYEYTKINSMKIRINGTESIIRFKTPIENTFVSYDDHCFAQRNMPIYIFPQSFVGNNETEYVFSIQALKNTVVKSFDFNDFLSFYEANVYINDNLVGTVFDVFPIELKLGDILSVKGKIKTRSEDLTSKENYYLNLCVECEFAEGNMTEYYPLVATFIGNINDAKDFVTFINDKQKSDT